MSLTQAASRLTYRLFDVSEQSLTPQDLEEIWTIDQDPQVMQFINGGKKTTREELHEVYVPRLLSYTNKDTGYGMWRVALADTDDCIGEIIVRPMHFFSDSPDYHDLELGWRFKRACWGKGYATEAARYVMQKMSQRAEVKSFCAIADTDNAASIGIMKKLGMTFVEHTIHQDPLGDFDVDVYRIVLR